MGPRAGKTVGRGAGAVGEAPEEISADPNVAAEWRRILQVSEDAGRPLQAQDREALILYCRAWAINRRCYEHIQKFGPIVIWPNTLPGQSPHYKAWKESAAILRGLFADLGLTPAARKFDNVEKKDSDEPDDLEL